jgi:GAF domain-containing protein
MINILKKKLPEPELKEILDNILQQAMLMNGTRAATLQILNKNDQSLEIAASYGLSDEFIDHFRKVTISDGSVCSRALQSGKTVFIGDITQDKLFTSHLLVALRNNINAVMSTPLICSKGNVIGMMSTHFKITRKPTKEGLKKFETFAKHAADKIDDLIST